MCIRDSPYPSHPARLLSRAPHPAPLTLYPLILHTLLLHPSAGIPFGMYPLSCAPSPLRPAGLLQVAALPHHHRFGHDAHGPPQSPARGRAQDHRQHQARLQQRRRAADALAAGRRRLHAHAAAVGLRRLPV
eukprot:4586883-Prymnesium_polylepis.1